MSQKILSGVFAVVLASSAAFSQSISPADVQLAARAGVEPGLYTTAQMIQIIEARRDGDMRQVAFVLSQSNSVATRADVTTAGTFVSPEGLSTVEEIQLQEARRENEHGTEAFILSGSNRQVPLPASAVTSGEAQLAAVIGVDPADYTLAELTAMQAAIIDE